MDVARVPKAEDRAAIVLAGGEGARLRPLTRKIAGEAIPKQFCPVIGRTTLLEQTLERASLSVAPYQTLTVVTRGHERLYSPLLADAGQRNVLVQPENRGTAPAILYSLLKLSKIAPRACVAVFPSDHFVSDERIFMRHVDLAFDAVREQRELVVLLGIAPDCAETAYGWIEADDPIPVNATPLFRVRRFWEKPAASLAKRLMQRGCLWNSFVIVARLSSLLGLIMIALPELWLSFARIRSALMTPSEQRKVERLYARLELANFSRDVLAKHPDNLAVLPVRGVEWSDLGEPSRVMKVMARLGMDHQWHAA